MDFEFILRVAERRIKAALGKAEPGKMRFTPATGVKEPLSLTLRPGENY